MKYYIIAGEASGDLHGSNLIKALRQKDPEASIRAWGGDLMEAAGAEIAKHYRDLAFMGFVEVVRNLRTILDNFKVCKTDIINFQPDAVILLDYPGFNLRIAKWAKRQGLRVYYYISPQLWAWHSGRVYGIKASVDQMFVILPFEPDFYRQYGMEVTFVGHPLLDVVTDYPTPPDFRAEHGLSDQPIVALLPGSRKQEISKVLATMLQLVPQFPDYQYVVAGAPAIPAEFYQQLFAQAGLGSAVKLLQNQTYDLLAHAYAALVTSGTATLETALFQVPQVVCYSGSAISYTIAKRLVNVKYISLVNLIVDRPLVQELIQKEFTLDHLVAAFAQLTEQANRQRIIEGYVELEQTLGQSGASAKTAQLIVEDLQSQNFGTHFDN